MSGLGSATVLPTEVNVGPKGPMERNEFDDNTLRLQHIYEDMEREIGHLVAGEVWWRDRFSGIESLGYGLRSRYHPNWQPSWMESGQDFFTAEDGLATISRDAMDAVRIEDGRQVTLKKVLPEEGPYELSIMELFSSPGVKEDSRNHCAQLLELIELSQDKPNGKLMVMPFLRPFENPRFQTYGEFVAFFMQISEGLSFMHEMKVAHGDCTMKNIMFDPSGMYPQGCHPVELDWSMDFKERAKRFTRTERPPRYYFTNFGLSRQYTSLDVLDEPVHGGDNSAPEYRRGVRCNPFRTDVYYLGNLVRDCFMRKYSGFEFMRELVEAMTDENPVKRPTIGEVVERFDHIRDSLSVIKLRSPIMPKNDPVLFTVFRHAIQMTRTVPYIICRRPAIPVPSGPGSSLC